jgi:hypothetical protein
MALLNSTALWMEVVVTEVHTRTLWFNATESWSLPAPEPTTEILVTPGVDLDGVLVWPDMELEPVATATETTLPEAPAETPAQTLVETSVETPAETLGTTTDPPFPSETITLTAAPEPPTPALPSLALTLPSSLALTLPQAPSPTPPRVAATATPLQNSLQILIASSLSAPIVSSLSRIPSSQSRSPSRSPALYRSHPRPRKHAVTAPVRAPITPSPRAASALIPKVTKRFNGVVRANWSPFQYTGGGAAPRVCAALALAALCAGALLLA